MNFKVNFKDIKKFINDFPVFLFSDNFFEKELQKKELSSQDLFQILILEPLLLIKLLTVISKHYSRKVTSLLQEMILLGSNSFRNLALSLYKRSSSKEEYNLNHNFFNFNEYWAYLVGVAFLSKQIASNYLILSIREYETYFIAGLLHKIGHIFLVFYLKDDYQFIVEKALEENIDICKSEKFFLNFDHVDIGRICIEEWGLNSYISVVNNYQYKPEEVDDQYKKLIYTIQVASFFVEKWKIGADYQFSKKINLKNALNYLKLEEKDILTIKENLLKEVKMSYAFMKN